MHQCLAKLFFRVRPFRIHFVKVDGTNFGKAAVYCYFTEQFGHEPTNFATTFTTIAAATAITAIVALQLIDLTQIDCEC